MHTKPAGPAFTNQRQGANKHDRLHAMRRAPVRIVANAKRVAGGSAHSLHACKPDRLSTANGDGSLPNPLERVFGCQDGRTEAHLARTRIGLKGT